MITKGYFELKTLFGLVFLLLISVVIILGVTCGSINIGNESSIPISNTSSSNISSNITSSISSSSSNTYYVAKTGSDSNPGTESQPWLTIQKAANTLVAGDTAYVKAGTYNEQVIPSRSGSSGAWISYKAYPGDTVIIDGSGLSIGLAGMFYIRGKS